MQSTQTKIVISGSMLQSQTPLDQSGVRVTPSIVDIPVTFLSFTGFMCRVHFLLHSVKPILVVYNEVLIPLVNNLHVPGVQLENRAPYPPPPPFFCLCWYCRTTFVICNTSN